MVDNELLMDLTFPSALPISPDRESYIQFLEQACAQSAARTIVISFPVPCGDPLLWFKSFEKDGFGYYWEQPQTSTAIAACGMMEVYTSQGHMRFDALNKKICEAQDSILHFNLSTGDKNGETYFLGGFSFFDEINDAAWQGFAPASFTLPEYLIRKKGKKSIASIALNIDTLSSLEELHEGITRKISHLFSVGDSPKDQFSVQAPVAANGKQLSASMHDHHDWIETVIQAKKNINKGVFKKVVLGRQLTLQLPQQYAPYQVLNRLRTRYPKCTTFYIQHKNSGAFIGSSPELLLSVEGNQVQTEALAGSIARGNSEKEDSELASALLQSEKDKQEHQIVVNHIKKLLAPFVENLNTNHGPEVKKLANVQHLQTPIRGKMSAPASANSIIGDLHPTPAVGGSPRETALPYIAEHELFDRGWFAGPVGWITSKKKAEFSVAIRSGLINDDTARLFAGCGIVADSDPETEWQETNLKFMPMLSALNYD